MSIDWSTSRFVRTTIPASHHTLTITLTCGDKGRGRAMADDRLYLRQDIQVEPLVDSWYAWAHLIPPATTARNITHRHFKIMDSYLNAPQVHANAVSNP